MYEHVLKVVALVTYRNGIVKYNTNVQCTFSLQYSQVPLLKSLDTMTAPVLRYRQGQ